MGKDILVYCESPSCVKVATLQCPTCVKLDLKASFFCTQQCFKDNWNNHKIVHKCVDNSKKCAQAYKPWPSYGFTGALRPHPQSKKREVPRTIPRPDYADDIGGGVPVSEQKMRGNSYVKPLDKHEIDDLRVACRLGRQVLDEVAKVIDVGVTTDELDRVAHEASVDLECYPSPLNYYKFPKSCCTSVNEVICHGIPDFRPLKNGDICNVDITVYHRGYHGDLNETFLMGTDVSDKAKNLVKTTWECLKKSIDAVKPGVRYRDMGDIIQKHAASQDLSVVKSYCGHGIHKLFHCAPNIPHYAKNKAVGVMKEGHSFTIEPMINLGVWQDQTWPDNWTSVTIDGEWSAQFEQTMVVTDSGVEVLTARQGKPDVPYFMDKL